MKQKTMVNDKNTPSLQKFQPGVYYSVSATENQSLQVILEQQKKIIIESNAIVWLSDKLHMKPKESLLMRIVNSTNRLLELSNPTSDPKVIGFGQYGHNGPIAILKSENFASATGFYCNRNNFLFCTDKVDITVKNLPVQSPPYNLITSLFQFYGNSYYYCKFPENDISSGIFLQSTGLIIESTLNLGDSILINSANIIAIEDTCVIQSRLFTNVGSSPSPSSSSAAAAATSMRLLSGNFVKIEGRGTIYYSAFNDTSTSPVSRIHKVHQNSTLLGLLLHFMTTIVFLYTVVLVLSKFMIEIDMQENNNDNNNNNNNNIG